MQHIGAYRGYGIYWTDPAADGGRGSGEVRVNSEYVTTASTRAAALKTAQRYIDDYLARMGR
jgi:hypothetical protein